MVDMEIVKERLLRGAYVGAGSFASGLVGGAIEANSPLGSLGSSVGQVGVGLGVSVGADYVFDPRQDDMFNDMVEFAGYGVEGAGFANIGEEITNRVQTGAAAGDRVVEISANADQTGQPAVEEEEEEVLEEEQGMFSLDV